MLGFSPLSKKGKFQIPLITFLLVIMLLACKVSTVYGKESVKDSTIAIKRNSLKYYLGEYIALDVSATNENRKITEQTNKAIIKIKIVMEKNF